MIRASRDLGQMAGECAAAVPRSTLPWWTRSLMGTLGNAVEADTLSYLYFDRSCTEAVVDLGYADAARQEEALVHFFGGDA